MIEFYLHLGDRRFGSFALYLVVFEYSGFRECSVEAPISVLHYLRSVID